jgi:HNH endonuclease
MIAHAHPTPSSAAASAHAPASRPLELLEARRLRDLIAALLRKEQAARADFLVALADFDQRRGWEPLGHASLFAFLVVELGLSKSAAYYRRSAAELLQDFPEVIEPLREGKLCLSTIGELAKVLTEENRAVVTPRFFGLSAREAQEVVAELQPRHVPSTRMIVTRVLDQVAAPAHFTQPVLSLTVASPSGSASASASASESASAPPTDLDPNVAPLSRFPTSGIANGGGTDGGAASGGVVRLVRRGDEITPLTAHLHRVHFNVGRQVVQKLKAAREGLSHAIRGATMEQVLEVALDLLLEKQAKARGQVKRPRTSLPVEVPREEARLESAAEPQESPPLAFVPTEPSPHRRTGPREAIPAAVSRAVWERDGGHCQWPLDAGGNCGSTHRLELDHVVPWALGGESTPANLRLVCARHNQVAARRAFGARCVERAAQRRAPNGR